MSDFADWLRKKRNQENSDKRRQRKAAAIRQSEGRQRLKIIAKRRNKIISLVETVLKEVKSNYAYDAQIIKETTGREIYATTTIRFKWKIRRYKSLDGHPRSNWNEIPVVITSPGTIENMTFILKIGKKGTLINIDRIDGPYDEYIKQLQDIIREILDGKAWEENTGI